MKLPALSSKTLLTIGAVAVLSVAVSPGIYFYKKYQEAVKNPQQLMRNEAQVLASKVGRLMSLPSDEEPTVATVTDKEKLSGQPFFANAENGDRVLVYSKARKAILFRPRLNIIVEVAPVNPLASPAPTVAAVATSAASPTPPAPLATPALVRVYLYNGTSAKGLTIPLEGEIKRKVAGVEVVGRDLAAKDTYTKTGVVDLTGSRGKLAKEIAIAVGGEVVVLPPGEKKPEEAADILVIAGSEYIKE